MIIAGDVGGTKTRLALYEPQGAHLAQIVLEQFESARYLSLEDIVARFLKKHAARPAAGCFGIPGPVVDGTVKVTNLPWELSERKIEQGLEIPRVKLVNDLVATAAAIPSFTEKDLLTLHPATPARGANVTSVVAPGTGLGHALLVTEGEQYQVLPSEGGHANFAPSNDEEFELAHFLRKKLSFVSVESVLSGPGLMNIYEFLRDTGKFPEPPALASRLQKEIPAGVVIAGAIGREFPICEKALDMFCHAVGSHAGNFMLTTLSTAGVYLGGGLPPRMLPLLATSSLLPGYLQKGKLSYQVETTPLHIIKDDHAAVRGAAKLAWRLL